MTGFILIAFGGGLGSMLRALLSQWLAPRLSAAGAILLVNLSGSLLIGAVFGLGFATLAPEGLAARPPAFDFFAIGLLGGYTTVSTYALQSLTLWQQGRWGRAVALALGSALVCPLGAALGLGAIWALVR